MKLPPCKNLLKDGNAIRVFEAHSQALTSWWCGIGKLPDYICLQSDGKLNCGVNPSAIKAIQLKITGSAGWCLALCVLSCQNPQPLPQAVKAVVVQPIAADTLWVKNLAVNSSFFRTTQFLNGDTLVNCSTKEAWAEAVRKKQPAYCKSNSGQHDSMLLYNYYAINDSRGLAKAGNLLTYAQATELVSTLESEPKEMRRYFKKEYCSERNFRGNLYNLGFVSYWLQDVPANKPMALIIDTEANRLRIAEAHPGNGFLVLAVTR